jgi:drug/metabolite transporter (DMT)-like permease
VTSLIIPPFDALCAMTAGGVCLGVALTLYNVAGAHVPAARTTLLLLLEVILAPVWTFLFTDEIPTIRTLIGGIYIYSHIYYF